MKVLQFNLRGEIYRVDAKARIITENLKEFSNSWKFVGGIKHPRKRTLDVTLEDAFKNPSLLDKCLMVHNDHGFMKLSGGKYNGKLPRIENAKVINFSLPKISEDYYETISQLFTSNGNWKINHYPKLKLYKIYLNDKFVSEKKTVTDALNYVNLGKSVKLN